MLRQTRRCRILNSALAIVAALSLGAGCAVTSPGASLVGRGEHYQSGDAFYDRFFDELHASQVAMALIPEEELKERRTLASAVTAPTDAPDDVAAAVEARVRQLAKSGVRLRLELSGEPGDEQAAAKLLVEGSLTSQHQALVRSVEGTAQRELELLARLAEQLEKLERLESMALGLERNVDNAFRMSGLPKRAEVSKNLHDAQALIPLMEARAQETASSARRLLNKLEHVVATLEPVPAAPPAPELAPDREEPAKAAGGASPKKRTVGKPPPPGVTQPSERPPPARPAAAPSKPAASPSPDFEP